MTIICIIIIAFKKKVEALAKEKNCEIVGDWVKSLCNHLYWCAVSTKSGKGDEIKAKWLSVINHIHNKHSGHGKIFPKCGHGRLRGRDRKKKWFKARKLAIYYRYKNIRFYILCRYEGK